MKLMGFIFGWMLLFGGEQFLFAAYDVHTPLSAHIGIGLLNAYGALLFSEVVE